MNVYDAFFTFNRGIVDIKSTARIYDIEKIRQSALEQENWLPYTLGNMKIRNGTVDKGSTYNNKESRFKEFVYSIDDKAILEFSKDNVLRVWLNDKPISYATVTTSIANDDFTTDLSSWTDVSTGTGAASWGAGGLAVLIGGSGTSVGAIRQAVTPNPANTEHALKLKINRGDIGVKVGSTAGGAEYFELKELDEGYYYLTFTPTGTFYVELYNTNKHNTIIDFCKIHTGGELVIPISVGIGDFTNMRFEQSADVMFVGEYNKAPYTINRYGTKSWGVVKYYTKNGIFKPINTSDVTMYPSGLSGNVTITSNMDYFKANDVGRLIKIQSVGQNVSTTVNTDLAGTNEVKVTGTGNTRDLSVNIAGTFAGTITLQRSIGTVGSWEDVENYTAPISKTYNDGLSNQIVYYRLYVKAGNWTSGSATLSLSYAGGSNYGIGRIVSYINSKQVEAIVQKDFYNSGSTAETKDWYIGAWGGDDGYPFVPMLNDGRLWWYRGDDIYASTSNNYFNFDADLEGDSAAIARTIGHGVSERILWAKPLHKILLGGQLGEFLLQSSEYKETITAKNSKLSYPSNKGSANVDGLKVDNSVFFVHRSGTRIFRADYDGRLETTIPRDMTILAPNLSNNAKFVKLAMQMKPDLKVYAITDDGNMYVLSYDAAEEVQGWCKFTTDGDIKDIVILPSDNEDIIYLLVKRGVYHRFEKMALDSECIGDDINILLDSSVIYDDASTTTIGGLDHLEGKKVKAWGNKKYLGEYLVLSGMITLSEAVTKAVVGLGYKAYYKSNKLTWITSSRYNKGTNYGQFIRLINMKPLCVNTHNKGLKFGQYSCKLESMPLIEQGKSVTDGVYDYYDEESVPVEGTFTNKCYFVLECEAPYPADVLGVSLGVDVEEKY